MDSHARIAVVGGGIFGCSTALALGRQGFSSVELLERQHLGAGSTALAGGLLSLHTWNEADAQLILETRRLLEALVAWGGAQDVPASRTAWAPCGGLTIAPASRRDLLEGFERRVRRLGFDAEVLSAQECARRFSWYQVDPSEAALWSQDGGVLESTDVLELVRASSKALGVRVREGVVASRLVVEEGTLAGLELAGGERRRFDAVVVCGGSWTKRILATAGAYVPLAPYRTQIAAIDLPGAAGAPILHDVSNGFYARTESEARILAGDGTQLREFDPDDFNPAPDAGFVEAIAGRVLARFAKGGEARFRKGWAGLCAGTPDRRPIAGPVPGVPGLWVLSGDNGFGLMRGLSLGARVAGLFSGRPIAPDDEGLRPDRFGARPPRQFPLAEGFSYPPQALAAKTLARRG